MTTDNKRKRLDREVFENLESLELSFTTRPSMFPTPTVWRGGGEGEREEEVLKCNAAVVKPAIAEQRAKG